MGFSIQDYLEHNKIELGKVSKEVGDSTFKGGHNDLRKTNYDVKITEDGKLDLYTHKTVLTESKINEASEVSLGELKPEQQKQIKTFEKIIGGKYSQIWGGIHGGVVTIDKKSFGGTYRFDVDTMKKLIASKIRWVEGNDDSVTIGF